MRGGGGMEHIPAGGCQLQQFDVLAKLRLREGLLQQPGNDGVNIVAQLDVHIDDVGVVVVNQYPRMPESILEEERGRVSIRLKPIRHVFRKRGTGRRVNVNPPEPMNGTTSRESYLR